MPRFISIHRAPGLDPEEIRASASHVLNAPLARYIQSYVNLAEGLIVSIYDADSREKLSEQFELLGFPFEEIQELQFAQSRAELEEMVSRGLHS